MATIIIPTPLRKYTDQKRTFETDQSTLAGAVRELTETYPEVRKNLLDEEDKVRSYIKIYVGEQEVRPSSQGQLELDPDTEVSIIPAIAGGC